METEMSVARSVQTAGECDHCKRVLADFMPSVQRHSKQKKSVVIQIYFDSQERPTAYCCGNPTASCTVLMRRDRMT